MVFCWTLHRLVPYDVLTQKEFRRTVVKRRAKYLKEIPGHKFTWKLLTRAPNDVNKPGGYEHYEI